MPASRSALPVGLCASRPQMRSRVHLGANQDACDGQYMQLHREQGNGLGRVMDEPREFGLRGSEFNVSDNLFCVGVYRMALSKFGEMLYPSRQP